MRFYKVTMIICDPESYAAESLANVIKEQLREEDIAVLSRIEMEEQRLEPVE